MDSINNRPQSTIQRPDIETGNADAAPVRPSRRRPLLLTAGGLAAAGAIGAGVYFALAGHHKAAVAPTLAPLPTPAPTPAATPHVALPPVPAPAPAPNNNVTGFVNVLPFTMAKKTAMYVGLPVTGGEKFAVVLTDAGETCQTLSASPVRSASIQELDLCQVTNGSAIVAQNGRIIKNGQQFPSTAVSLNGTVDANRVLSGNFHMNTTNDGYVTGNFSAQPCDTLVFSNFCDLQN